MHEQPNYFSILSASVRYSKELKPNEKLLFSEITALSNKDGYCFASNSYFAKLYNVETETVSRWISHLKNLGFLQVEIIYSGKKIEQRKLYPVLDFKGGIDKKINTYCEKNQEGIDKKVNRGIDKKVKDNNTIINNTSINKVVVVPETDLGKIISVLENNVGMLSPLLIQKIQYMLEDWKEVSDDYVKIVKYAFEQAILANAGNKYAYAQQLLNTWKMQNFASIEQVKTFSESRKKSAKQKYKRKTGIRKDSEFDWSDV